MKMGGWHIISITAISKLFLFSSKFSSGWMQPQVHFLDPSVQSELPSHFRVRILPVSHSDQLTALLLDAQFCQLPMNQCMKNDSRSSQSKIKWWLLWNRARVNLLLHSVLSSLPCHHGWLLVLTLKLFSETDVIYSVNCCFFYYIICISSRWQRQELMERCNSYLGCKTCATKCVF